MDITLRSTRIRTMNCEVFIEQGALRGRSELQFAEHGQVKTDGGVALCRRTRRDPRGLSMAPRVVKTLPWSV
jgi:hypothetical protein